MGGSVDRVAVFVDAGYLFAQGSALLTGSSKPRADLILDAPAVVAELKTAATAACTCSLLRIYWYDGTIKGTRLTADQARLANLDDVKVRLGSVNSFGQQKGVDPLIITDLIELARQKAICDAVLIAGDEDIRVGVQIAQNYGVRVHLLGIAPSRGNQSPALMQEADTRKEWHSDVVRRFLAERTAAAPAVAPVVPTAPIVAVAGNASTQPQGASAKSAFFDPTLELTAKEFVDALQQSEIEALEAYWKSARGLPPELDRRLLPAGRTATGHDLSSQEKVFIRSRVQKMVKDRAKGTGASP